MRQKYIPQIYKVRVHRTDGTRQLLLGQSGRLPRSGGSCKYKSVVRRLWSRRLLRIPDLQASLSKPPSFNAYTWYGERY